jgi:hypothetical protein
MNQSILTTDEHGFTRMSDGGYPCPFVFIRG